MKAQNSLHYANLRVIPLTHLIAPTFEQLMRRGATVLDTHIDALHWDEVIAQLNEWTARHESRYVTLCNVHSVVTASQESAFRQVINEADLALPDGAPVAWALRQAGHPEQMRINGPDLMWRYLKEMEARNGKVYFYGSTDQTLSLLKQALHTAFPTLQLAGMVSPPFRALSAQEDDEAVALINESGAQVVFVGLGCPKQEMWMAAHRGRVQAVMLGVGAAFDYHAGTIHRAPPWMQRHGLEWLHRLISEPRRLARRYAVTNSIFIYRMVRQKLAGR